MSNPIRDNELPSDLVGLLPAGGKATRISPLPCSKELFPIGFGSVHQGSSPRPKVVSHYLLEKIRLAGAKKAYIILRPGKWDIPAYFGDGKMLDMHLGYLMIDSSPGVPYTLDQANPFVQNTTVAFGFPDIIFHPEDAFIQLLDRQAESNADIVLGLFPAHQPSKVDMVVLDADGRVRGIQIKPSQTHLRYTWIIAVWTSDFTRFMHEYVIAPDRINDKNQTIANVERKQELFMGDIVQAAIHNDIEVDKVVFTEGTYLDIGTPEDMIKAMINPICDWRG